MINFRSERICWGICTVASLPIAQKRTKHNPYVMLTMTLAAATQRTFIEHAPAETSCCCNVFFCDAGSLRCNGTIYKDKRRQFLPSPSWGTVAIIRRIARLQPSEPPLGCGNRTFKAKIPRNGGKFCIFIILTGNPVLVASKLGTVEGQLTELRKAENQP